MAENKNPFDAHFQRRLNDLESPVSPDLFDRLQARRGAATPEDAPLRTRLAAHASPVSAFVFDNVVAARERRKKRRIMFWRWATAVAALLLIGAFLIHFKTKNAAVKTIAQSHDSAANNAAANSPKTRENNADNAALNGPEAREKSENGEALNNAQTSKNTEGGNLSKTRSSGLETAANSNQNAHNLTPNGAKIDLNEQQLTDEPTNNSIFNSIRHSIGNPIRNTVENTENALQNAPKTVARNGNTEGSNAELVNKSDALEAALDNRLNASGFSTLPLDFLNTMPPKTLDFSAKRRENPCTDPENGCPTFGNGRRRRGERAFYVDAFVAPEYVMRRLTKNLDESEKLLAARDSIERTQYAVSAGVRAAVVFGNGFTVRTGLVYNQINERAHFDSLGVGSITTTYKEVILPNGRRDTISTTITIIDGIFRKNRHNQYRSLDIPLQIGYEMPMKNGWVFGFNGGVNLNITAWQKADIVGTDLQQLTVSSGINAPNPVFRTRLGMSLTGSVAAYRQLTRALQIIIEPSIRYGLQPITRADYALKQQYATAGLIVGLRLRL